MRRVFEPIVPAVSLVVTVVAILALAEPLVKLAVEAMFSMAGY